MPNEQDKKLDQLLNERRFEKHSAGLEERIVMAALANSSSMWAWFVLPRAQVQFVFTLMVLLGGFLGYWGPFDDTVQSLDMGGFLYPENIFEGGDVV